MCIVHSAHNERAEFGGLTCNRWKTLEHRQAAVLVQKGILSKCDRRLNHANSFTVNRASEHSTEKGPKKRKSGKELMLGCLGPSATANITILDS